MTYRYCPQCGRELPVNARMCPCCGCEVNPEKKKLSWTNKLVLLVVACMIGFGLWNVFYDIAEGNQQERDAYMEAADILMEDGDDLYQCGRLILEVWNNSICGIRDPDTDPYVFPQGADRQDFEAALDLLYQDPQFSRRVKTVYENQQTMRRILSQMEDSDMMGEEFMQMFRAYLEKYVDLSMMVVSPTGNYLTYSAQLMDLVAEMNELQEEIMAQSPE